MRIASGAFKSHAAAPKRFLKGAHKVAFDDLARQANEAETGMAVFARILEATRANLNVMQRLRELRASRLEYGELPGGGWVRTESGHGDN